MIRRAQWLNVFQKEIIKQTEDAGTYEEEVVGSIHNSQNQHQMHDSNANFRQTATRSEIQPSQSAKYLVSQMSYKAPEKREVWVATLQYVIMKGDRLKFYSQEPHVKLNRISEVRLQYQSDQDNIVSKLLVHNIQKECID